MASTSQASMTNAKLRYKKQGAAIAKIFTIKHGISLKALPSQNYTSMS